MNREKIAKGRRINFMFVVLTLSIVFLFNFSGWGVKDDLALPLKLLSAVAFIDALWVVVGASLAHSYILRIQAVASPDSGWEFIQLYFFDGISLRLLKERAAEADKVARDIKERATQFPEHAQSQIMETLHTKGAVEAIKLIAQIESQILSDAKQAEERERREEKRERQNYELLREGVVLGIPSEMMTLLIVKDIEEVRAIVAKKCRENNILEAAGRHSCVGIVTALIKRGDVDASEVVVVKSAAIIEKAATLGIEEDIRRIIAGGNLSYAETKVVVAKQHRDFEALMEGFEVRIGALNPTQQSEPRKRLKVLRKYQHEQREFRKALHALKKILGDY